MRLNRTDAVAVGFLLSVVIAIAAVITGALAAAFSGYSVGQYVHDLALLVLGLAAVTYAVSAAPTPLSRRERQGTTYQAPPPPST